MQESEKPRGAFLKTAAAAAATTVRPGYPAGSDVSRIGMIGAGGRSTEAASQALNAGDGARLAAMADVALIADAAKFHPMRTYAAIQAGKHVFVEKPHAIDPAGIKVVEAACELANLCVLSGLQSRYTGACRETIQRIHDGAIGEVAAIEEESLRPPYVLYPRQLGPARAGAHEMPRHGRATPRGQIHGCVFDHHAAAPGAKGRAEILKGRIQGESKWQYAGPSMYARSPTNPYQIEHNELFKAIRSGKPLNSGDFMARGAMIGIMGQVSCHTGKEATWEQVSASDFYFPPKPEDVRADMEPPVKPAAEGIYPVYIPGVANPI
jgi:myo-inositol 2-dehydrogenase/D-chiro-inositol 1-dehydrogenase